MSPAPRQDAKSFLNALVPEWKQDLSPRIRSALHSSPRTIVVLDDDPTGTQTVYNVPVLTVWEQSLLDEFLERGEPLFYILTNSRSMDAERARAINREIAERLAASAHRFERAFRVISRSDSTLRGHYPVEVEALQDTLRNNSKTLQGHLIVPCFVEGGRMTIQGIHYLREGDELVPVAETEFARDKDFGFRSSDLREWVQEKTRGEWRAEQVTLIPLDTVRRGGPEAVAQVLRTARGPIAADAVTYADLSVLTAALLQVEAKGHAFLFRTAASFVQAYAGLAPRPLLTRSELVKTNSKHGGLIVVGSYTDKTTRQVARAQQTNRLAQLELNVKRVLQMETRETEVEQLVRDANNAIAQGRDTMIFTSRAVESAASHLEIGAQVSSALAEVVARIQARPRYVIAKGGITSSDVATRGLNVQRAMVLGQIRPGVPVWRLDELSRFPNLSYVVFPGNVGQDTTLAEIISELAEQN